MSHIDTYPKLGSFLLALGAGIAAILLVANASSQLAAVGLEVGGLLVGLLGVLAIRRRHRITGGVLLLVALVVASAAIALGWIRAGSPTLQVELLPGMVGLFVLAGGAIAERKGYARYFVIGGSGLLFLGVLVSGVVHGAPRLHLLAAGAAAVVAWDTAEQGINLGEQVGNRASSWSSELVHAGGSAVVGVVGVGLGLGVYAVGFEGVSLTGLVLLLAGAVTLIVALYS